MPELNETTRELATTTLGRYERQLKLAREEVANQTRDLINGLRSIGFYERAIADLRQTLGITEVEKADGD